MFRVDHDGISYHISTGDGRPVKASTLAEVQQALEHFYTASHTTHVAKCPLCRDMAARGTR